MSKIVIQRKPIVVYKAKGLSHQKDNSGLVREDQKCPHCDREIIVDPTILDWESIGSYEVAEVKCPYFVCYGHFDVNARALINTYEFSTVK